MFYRIFSLCFLLVTASVNSAQLIVEGGMLVGANGVLVDDVLFNVEFKDGTFDDVFAGQTTPDIDPFNDQLFGEALLSQVFIGIYDSNPLLTYGCADEPFNPNGNCTVLSYSMSGSMLEIGGSIGKMSITNSTLEDGDRLTAYAIGYTHDLATDGSGVWADWTVATVPIPAGVWFFGSALAGLMGYRVKVLR